MKNIIITLAALATLSTASLAGQRTDVDARDRAFGDVNSGSVAGYAGFDSIDSAGFVIEDTRSGTLTAFERTTLQSIQNEDSRNN